MKAVPTMTPAEEAAWQRDVAQAVPIPTHQHIYAVLHASGLRWVEIAAFFDLPDGRSAEGATRSHDATTCRWCRPSAGAVTPRERGR